MWPSARLRRSANVPGLSSADTQKSLKSCRTASRRRSISCWYLPPNGGSVQPPKKSTGYKLANLNHPQQPAHAGRNLFQPAGGNEREKPVIPASAPSEEGPDNCTDNGTDSKETK